MLFHEAEIWGIARAGEGCMVFLRALEKDEAVPVYIGQLEAQAILIGCGNIAQERPLTADLLVSVLRVSGFTLDRVEVTEIRDNTYYARLILREKELPAAAENPQPLYIDCRPSDGLALAARWKAPIFVSEEVLDEAGIPADELVEDSLGMRNSIMEHRDYLKRKLEEAVAREDYEKAAEIRDQLVLLDGR
jgi:bifunctional DNase/RNase